MSRPLLDEFLNRVSGIQDIIEFIVQRPFKPAVEIGYDSSCIDGRFSQVALWGIEEKDKAYFSQVCDYNKLPAALRHINEVFSPIYADLGVRGFFSSEVRQKSAQQYIYIDPCMRAGSPPSHSYIRLFNNWADHILAGAQGEVVDLQPDGSFAVQVMLLSQFFARNRWLAVRFPEQYRDRLGLHGHTIQGGTDYCVNLDPETPCFGAAIGIGSSLKEAIDEAMEVAESVQAAQIEVDDETALRDINKKIAELSKTRYSWQQERMMAEEQNVVVADESAPIGPDGNPVVEEPVVAEAEVAEAAEAEGAEDKTESKAAPEGYVPVAVVQEMREELTAVKSRAEQAATLLQQREEREARIRAQHEQDQGVQAAKNAEAARGLPKMSKSQGPCPDATEDPLGARDWHKERRTMLREAKRDAEIADLKKTIQGRDQAQDEGSFTARVQGLTQEFIKEHPDYLDAFKHVMAVEQKRAERTGRSRRGVEGSSLGGSRERSCDRRPGEQREPSLAHLRHGGRVRLEDYVRG